MIIGIDPGKSGGIAYWTDKDKAGAVKMPETTMDILDTLESLERYCNQTGDTMKLYLEHVHAFPSQGVKSVWTFGQNYGELRGIITALRIPFETISPNKWMNIFPARPKDKADRKLFFKNIAQERYPNLKVTYATADALCILEYGRIQNGQSE